MLNFFFWGNDKAQTLLSKLCDSDPRAMRICCETSAHPRHCFFSLKFCRVGYKVIMSGSGGIWNELCRAMTPDTEIVLPTNRIRIPENLLYPTISGSGS
jgi:hypothetical protein